MLPYGGYVNSVAVYDGKLAAAIESTNKQALGKVVIFNTNGVWINCFNNNSYNYPVKQYFHIISLS